MLSFFYIINRNFCKCIFFFVMIKYFIDFLTTYYENILN